MRPRHSRADATPCNHPRICRRFGVGWGPAGRSPSVSVPLIPAAVSQDEPSEWEKTELDQAQVEQRIKEYNSQINSNLFMSLVWGRHRAAGITVPCPQPTHPPPVSCRTRTAPTPASSRCS